ncbi:helix-turn-helix transcriptional regulator [Actinomycetospora termitidis]|uniref:LuxR family transcriptional regulator n=1 Tax=Actinomycetospora termitidis TaxID=3053470 RepID=A0ABT7M8B5_9PSEU|nr:LuxR family transcriptional regulator [Actinomycetospora sp. Odt1-22]MDL5156017.1 LuxR family transcriptional regulator [Actinomycetospora sp. Odt1-22]
MNAPSPHPGDLPGRSDELAVLTELVTDVGAGPAGARAAAGSVLVVVGDVGVGKTALLDTTARLAERSGVRVLRADGCSGESDIPWAALSQLLAPLLDEGPDDATTDVERQVLAAVHDPDTAASVRPSAFSFGVLRLLVRVARERPTLLVVDDTDRLDRESLRVLVFAARRVRRRDRLAIVLAGRGARRALPADTALPTLELRALDAEASATLVDTVSPGLDPGVRRDIVAAAEGNPLAVRELAAAGSARPTTLSAQVLGTFGASPYDLGEATARLLLLAAVADGESPAVIARAALGSVALAPWTPAEQAGLVVVDAAGVRFRHPLARAAVHASATADERRRAHLALAAEGTDPDRAAWHRAHASSGNDEAVASALAATATRAEAAGEFGAAERAWERASECSPDDTRRITRRHRALQAAYAGGDVDAVAEQHRKLVELTADPTVRTEATLLHAAAAMLRGRQRQAMRALLDVVPLVGVVDDAGAVLLAAFLGVTADFSGLPEHHDEAARILRHPALPTALRRVQDEADAPADLMWARASTGADRSRAASALRRALESGRAGPGAPANDLQNLGLIADRADDVRQAVELLSRAHAQWHHEGPGAFGAAVLANLLVDHGRWTEADGVIARWGALADARGLHRVAVELASPRAILLALRGDGDGAREVLDAARSRVDLADNLVLDLRLRLAGAVTASSGGDPSRAYRLLRGSFTADGEPRHPVLSARVVALLAGVATDADERAGATLIVGKVRALVEGRSSARMRMLLHHADALLGPEHESERHFRLALADPTGEDWPVERAMARLHYGEWLRRRRRGLEAREMLAAASESFEVLGARALVARVRTELRAAGGADHRDVPSTQDLLAELTPQQREVVLLAAEGLRNREIGQRLFLSPRTVGSHLHHAYPKLGVSGRHQLAALFRAV